MQISINASILFKKNPVDWLFYKFTNGGLMCLFTHILGNIYLLLMLYNSYPTWGEQGWARLIPGARDSICVSHVGGRSPSS